jgi:2-dehydro-3-deoxygalactonokinase
VELSSLDWNVPSRPPRVNRAQGATAEPGSLLILFADWTSTALTLHALAADGRVEGSRSAAAGAVGRDAAGYVAALSSLAGDWLDAADAIYVAGMATGRGGWRETGYADAPAGLSALLAGIEMVTLPSGHAVHLLPGLAVAEPLPDVMRGEEIKLFGLGEGFSGIAILPGRHAKWARIEVGRVTGFATFLSGEIAALLSRDSILSRLVPQGAGVSAAGLARGLGQRTSPLRSLFSARSLVLAGQLEPVDIEGYVAGLLIGAEIDEALAEFPLADSAVTLIGTEAACQPYAQGLADRGGALRIHRPDPTGLAASAIARLHALRLTGTSFHNMERASAEGGAT